METPIYSHDCTDCIFLGSWYGPTWIDQHNEKDFLWWDLYFCKDESPEYTSKTVVARYGNKGSQYQSGLSFAEENRLYMLYQARIRAIEKGYLKADEMYY